MVHGTVRTSQVRRRDGTLGEAPSVAPPDACNAVGHGKVHAAPYTLQQLAILVEEHDGDVVVSLLQQNTTCALLPVVHVIVLQRPKRGERQ